MINKLVVPSIAIVGVIAGLAGANIAASAESATATTTQATTATATGGTTTPTGPHQANGKTEVTLTGDSLTKATNAAKAKYPNATVTRAETDADGDGTYEVHMDDSGQAVTVFLDSSFSVTSTANGMSNKMPGGGPQQSSTTATNTTT